MNKEQFWNIVNEVHSSTDPRNQKEVLTALRDRLRNLPSEEILEWKQIFSFYQDAARRNDLINTIFSDGLLNLPIFKSQMFFKKHLTIYSLSPPDIIPVRRFYIHHNTCTAYISCCSALNDAVSFLSSK